jgi:hypothetical protein
VLTWLVQGVTAVDSSELELCINASCDGEPANCSDISGFVEEQTSISYDTFSSLVELIVEYFGPEGSSWEYNDGSYNQKSGYSEQSYTFSFSLASSNSHTIRLGSQSNLLNWLVETNIMGLSPAAIKKKLKLEIV